MCVLWCVADPVPSPPRHQAGPIAAALALGDFSEDVYPLANDVFSRSLEGISHALPSWGPDGVWPEGSK